jgi:predicted RNase H-like HicB family nuclease
VSLCPELDIAGQGDTIEEARENLREALELFFETASPEEIQMRLHEEVYVTRVEIAVGQLCILYRSSIPTQQLPSRFRSILNFASERFYQLFASPAYPEVSSNLD